MYDNEVSGELVLFERELSSTQLPEFEWFTGMPNHTTRSDEGIFGLCFIVVMCRQESPAKNSTQRENSLCYS